MDRLASTALVVPFAGRGSGEPAPVPGHDGPVRSIDERSHTFLGRRIVVGFG